MPSHGCHRHRRATTARALAAFVVVLLFFLLGVPAAAQGPQLKITSSALLVLDPEGNDACFSLPQACVESCSSVLRVDTLSDGQALLTPSGPDYALSCDTGFTSEDPSFRIADGPRGTINVSCAAMTAHGFEMTWPPPPSPRRPSKPVAPQPALAFDSFDCKGFGATGLDGKPYGTDGTLCRSVFNMPDARVMSAIFSRRAYFEALCHPWHCPTPGCSLNLSYPLLIMTAAQPGSGRVRVMPVGRTYGTCLDRRAWLNDAICTGVHGSVTYRIAEGRLLNETARPLPSDKPQACPLGTCPRKIFVPPALGAGGDLIGVKPGPRDNVCTSACDGGGKANATAKAIEYPSAPFQPPSFPCPTNVSSNVHLTCRPACLGWQGPCCAPGSLPGPSADCPACPPGARVDAERPVASARLRLASIVAPNASVPCTDFVRMADTELALAKVEIARINATYKAFLYNSGRGSLFGCPPREIVLAVTGGCSVQLSSSKCEPVNNTTPIDLVPSREGSANVSRTIERALRTDYWEVISGVPDGGELGGLQDVTSYGYGKTTVAALDPGSSPGGRGLLALKLEPTGCVYRYAVVEGALPGARGASAPVAKPGSPLPASARWCPGGTTKAAQPATLAEPGEPVPVCLVTKR